jgi:hypothetical protein
MKKYKPVSLKSVRSYALHNRNSKISISSFAGIPQRGDTVQIFLEKLPDVLAARDFRAVVQAIISARKKQRPVILGMGAHPIKLGLSPIIIEMMKKNIITALATNGACVIHDFEIAMAGHTSEDVAAELSDGSFGMAKDTGRGLNQVINKGVKKGRGIGEAVGDYLYNTRLEFNDRSLYANAYALGIPSTVHVAIGTDIIHMHPEADGSATGKGSLQDFKLLVSVISDLEDGVYINLGSAVILPEVFLKALNIARNLGHTVERITTVNMDFIQQYRPYENVLKRPTMKKGKSYALTGHHEIMFPLLSAAVIEGSQ